MCICLSIAPSFCNMYVRPLRALDDPSSVCLSLLLLAWGGNVSVRCSHADLRTRAGPQRLEVLQRGRLVRKHVEARGRIFLALHPALGEPVIEPMGGAPATPGEVGGGPIP